MSPTETVAPTTTRAPDATVPKRRVEYGRGLVTMARVEPAGGGLVIAVTAASMVVSSFIFADFLCKILGVTDWGASMSVITSVGGALAYPVSLALGDTWLNSGTIYSHVALGDLFAIAIYAVVAWALCYPIRLRIRREMQAAAPA